MNEDGDKTLAVTPAARRAGYLRVVLISYDSLCRQYEASVDVTGPAATNAKGRWVPQQLCGHIHTSRAKAIDCVEKTWPGILPVTTPV